MTEPMKQSWDQVGQGFETLGRLLKDRYAAHEGRPATPEGTQEERAALREAFDKLVTAAKDFGDRATDIAHDPEVKAQTKQVARALNTALSSTVDTIGDELGGLLKRTKGSQSDRGPEEGPKDEG
jgi:hypothetical protein